ncbi:MAG: DUF4870 domain-containing protein [Proteobacteria bacterium]|nr:DUF4870 domain-containing protein [Pseudomonadota bacterium]
MQEPNKEQRMTGNCSTGLSQSVSVLLAYLFSWVGGVVFLLIEKENRFVRFHAAQSTVMGLTGTVVVGILAVFSAIPILGFVFSLASAIIWLVWFIATVLLIIQSYHGNTTKLPVIGDLAEWLVESL